MTRSSHNMLPRRQYVTQRRVDYACIIWKNAKPSSNIHLLIFRNLLLDFLAFLNACHGHFKTRSVYAFEWIKWINVQQRRAGLKAGIDSSIKGARMNSFKIGKLKRILLQLNQCSNFKSTLSVILTPHGANYKYQSSCAVFRRNLLGRPCFRTIWEL